MKNIFKIGKCGIAAILTLCILLGITGTSVYAASIAEETTVQEVNEQELEPMTAMRCISFPSYPGNDPTVSPGENWEWKGPPGLGAWYNPSTTESLHPHLNSSDHDPHWDYIPYKNGPQYRIYPDNRVEPKNSVLVHTKLYTNVKEYNK